MPPSPALRQKITSDLARLSCHKSSSSSSFFFCPIRRLSKWHENEFARVYAIGIMRFQKHNRWQMTWNIDDNTHHFHSRIQPQKCANFIRNNGIRKTKKYRQPFRIRISLYHYDNAFIQNHVSVVVRFVCVCARLFQPSSHVVELSRQWITSGCLKFININVNSLTSKQWMAKENGRRSGFVFFGFRTQSTRFLVSIHR